MECAANLYKEKFNQDIGIDKNTKEVIESRQALEEQWCSDFKRHMRQHTPSLMNLWDVLNPDVPRLLEVFNDYVNDLRAKGVSGKAIEAANELKKTDFEMWIGKVTERSSADEQLQVGYSYRDGVGTTQDFAEAAKWFRKAALQGSAAGQNLLGNMYLQGQGVPEDHIESAKWYRKAALQGDAKAQFNLGFMYRMSQGVPQDHVESARWNRKAAEQGHASAQFNQGLLYARGQGVAKDLVRAYMWLSLGIEELTGANRANALKARKGFQKLMTPTQVTEAKRLAREWVEKRRRM